MVLVVSVFAFSLDPRVSPAVYSVPTAGRSQSHCHPSFRSFRSTSGPVTWLLSLTRVLFLHPHPHCIAVVSLPSSTTPLSTHPGPATLPRAPLAQAVCCSHRHDLSDNSLRLSVVQSTTRRELRFFRHLSRTMASSTVNSGPVANSPSGNVSTQNSGSRPSLRPSTNSKSSDGRRQTGSPADGGQRYVAPPKPGIINQPFAPIHCFVITAIASMHPLPYRHSHILFEYVV